MRVFPGKIFDNYDVGKGEFSPSRFTDKDCFSVERRGSVFAMRRKVLGDGFPDGSEPLVFTVRASPSDKFVSIINTNDAIPPNVRRVFLAKGVRDWASVEVGAASGTIMGKCESHSGISVHSS